jgi:hypothetical protein
LKLILCTREEAKRGRCNAHDQGRSVHFAVMHRKFSNDWDLPMRYERWFVLWEGKKPFRLLAKSKFPMLFANETAGGWTDEENWAGTMQRAGKVQRRWKNSSMILAPNSTTWLNVSGIPLPAHDNNATHDITESTGPQDVGKENWAYFTYTPSIAWAWRPKSAEIRREDRDAGAEDGSYLHSLNVGYLDDEIIVSIGLEDTAQAFAKAKASTLLQCLELCPGLENKREGATEEMKVVTGEVEAGTEEAT